MMTPPRSSLTQEDSLLLADIAAFNAAYANCIDDDRLEHWPDFFTEDCLYRVIPRENVDLGLPASIVYFDNRGMMVDRVVALRKANIYPAHYSRHIISAPVLLDGEGGGICAQASYVFLLTRMDGRSEVYSAGKYVDVFTRTEAGLRLKRRDVIFDTHRIETLFSTPI